MTFRNVPPWSIVQYPNLWSRESLRREKEGRKNRPVAVAVMVARPNLPDRIILLPITSKQSPAGELAKEIPANEKRRSGLDPDRPLWIILGEYNDDAVDRSYYMVPQTVKGQLSLGFFLPLLHDFIKRSREAKGVSRFP